MLTIIIYGNLFVSLDIIFIFSLITFFFLKFFCNLIFIYLFMELRLNVLSGCIGAGVMIQQQMQCFK